MGNERNLFGAVGGFIAGAAGKAGEAASGAADAASKAADEAGKAAAGAAGAAVETASKVADDAGKAVGGVAEEANKVASSAVGTATDAAGKAGAAVVEAAGVAAGAVASGAQALTVAAQDAAYELRKKRYAPVFPDEYFSEDYDRPNVIVLEDEDIRKGIDVCEGALGWFSKEGNLEVLHLYMKDRKRSGVDFHPYPALNAVYYVDTFNPSRYINVERYFEVARQDRMTELRAIAHALGAKSCTLESIETEKIDKRFRGRGKAAVKKGIMDGGTGDIDVEGEFGNKDERKIEFVQSFEGNAEPFEPELHWFAHDSEIKFLIGTRCNSGSANTTKKYQLKLNSSSVATMSLTMAANLDAVLKGLKVKTNASLEGSVRKELSRSFLWTIDF